MPEFTHRYLVLFRDVDHDHWSTDCGFNDERRAKLYAFSIVANLGHVAAARIKDREDDTYLFTIETNREARQ